MKQSAAVRDILKLVSGSVAARLISIAALMLFTRTLSKTEVAIFPVYLMLGGVANLFFNFGIFPIFVKLLPSLLRSDRQKACDLVLTGAVLILFGTVLVSILTAAFADRVAVTVLGTAAYGHAVRVMCIGFVAFAIAKLVEHVMWGRGQYGMTSVLQLLDAAVRPVTCVALYLLMGFEGIVIALVIAQSIVAAASVWCVRDFFRGMRLRFYPLGALFQQSYPFYFESYLMYARGDGDNWLVTFFLGPAFLAEYYVAKTLYSSVIMFSTAVDKVVAERFAREAHVPDVLAARAGETHRHLSQFAPPLMLFLITLTPFIMTVVGGDRYRSAAGPAMILLVLALQQILTIPIDRSVFAGTPSFFRLLKTLIESVGVMAGAIVMAPLAGINGIAAGRLLGQGLAALFGYELIRRKLGIHLGLRKLAISLACSLPGTILILALAPVAHGAAAAIGEAVASALVWLGVFAATTFLVDRETLVGAWRYAVGKLRDRSVPYSLGRTVHD
ncbi:MAG TPA: oligosaccharide flippase family protein [Rhizomicrobium sp.]|jgi:O-antigen/teichoic acid export membrane protein